MRACNSELYGREVRLSLGERECNDLAKRVGINFPWRQTGRRRARAPLTHDVGAGDARGERREVGHIL